jgi:dsRNA-specific ribonuclease
MSSQNTNINSKNDVFFDSRQSSLSESVQLTTDEIRDRILNEHNIYITKEFINGIFEKVGFKHSVKNLDNFQQAMIHSSYLEDNLNDPKTVKLLKDISPIDPSLKKKCIPLQKKSYERLEFLGDSIIRHAFGKYLFLRYPNEEEGFLTTNRSKMENKFALSEISKKFGLQKYAIVSRTIEQANGRLSYVTLTEDLFEAFVGALNLEIDDNKTIDFLWRIIEKELDVPETIRTQNNYKDQLMQYFHKIDVVKHDLHYVDDEYESNDGKKKYKTTVYDKNTGKPLGYGAGRSKKTSQQRAAKDALIKLGLLGNEQDQDEFFDVSVNDINTNTNIKSISNTESKSKVLVPKQDKSNHNNSKEDNSKNKKVRKIKKQ